MIKNKCDPIIILDEENKIYDVNDEMTNLLNVSKNDILNHNFDKILSERMESDLIYFHDEQRKVNIKNQDFRIIESDINRSGKNERMVILKAITDDERNMKVCVNKRCQFHDLIEAFPQPVVIVHEGKVVLANQQAEKLVGDTVGKNISRYLGDSTEIAANRIQEVLKTQKTGSPITYEIQNDQGKMLFCEMIPSFILYEGKPSIMSVIRDVTVQKHDLDHAARVQQMLLKRNTPLLENMLIETVYVPSKTVSGDFYFFEQKDNGDFIGIVGDVRGKGVIAAMNLSAFEVMFREVVHNYNDLDNIIKFLNRKVAKHMDEVYIATILFKINCKGDVVSVIGAGINEFYVVDADGMLHLEAVKGPFLGMFEDLEFEQVHLDKHECRRLMFTTDGFEEQVALGRISTLDLVAKNLFDLSNHCTNILQKQSYSLEGLHDDSSMVAIDFLKEGRSYEYIFKGLSDYKIKIPEILMSINQPDKAFNIELVLMELLTNAFKYGNKRDPDLPIRLSLSQYRQVIVIAVKDMGLMPKKLNIKEQIHDDELLDESGRGLFIINQLADRIYVNDKSIIVEMRI